MCQSKRQLKFFNAIGEIFVSSFTTSNKGLNNRLYLDNSKCVAIEFPKTYFSILFYIIYCSETIEYCI